MRLTPVLLIAIGIWGLVYPQSLFEMEETHARVVFLLIIALGAFSLWRTIKRRP